MNRRTISRWMLALLLANPLLIMAMEDAQQGAQAEQEQPAADAQEDAQEHCALCEDDVPVAEMRQLGCNHRACAQCLLDYKLNPGLNTDWQRARTILRCNRRGIQPGDQPCAHAIDERDIRAITGDEARVERYSWVMSQLMFDAPGSGFQRCPGPLYEPGPECNEVYIFERDQIPQIMRCRNCRRQYCSACRQPHRRGTPCPPVGQLALNNDNNNVNAEAQEQRAAQIAQNDELLRQTGAACPTCGRIIQKTEGCNHMHCPNEDCARLGRDDFCFICQVPWVQEVHGRHQFEELFCYLCRQPWGPRHAHHPEGQRYTIADWNRFTEPFCKYHARPGNQVVNPLWGNGLHEDGYPCQRREPIMQPMVDDVHAPVVQAPAQVPAIQPERPVPDVPVFNLIHRMIREREAARAQRQLELERLQTEEDSSNEVESDDPEARSEDEADERPGTGFLAELLRVHNEVRERRARRVPDQAQDDRERARLEVRRIFGVDPQQEEVRVQRFLELQQGIIFRDENHAREHAEMVRGGAQWRLQHEARVQAAREQEQGRLAAQERAMPVAQPVAEQVAAQPVAQEQVQPVADAQPAAQETAVEACTVCLDDEVAVADMRQLGCGHRFCAGCLGDRVALGLREWQEIDQHIRCPRRECPYVMNEADIRAITQDDAQVNRFNNILTDRFINANPNFRRCPTAECEIIYEFERPARMIRCARGCHQVYCSDCRVQHPRDVACGQANIPIQNNNNQAEQRQLEWIRANTRPCPNCRANIEKNEGCNHMTCRNCRHEFCWECLVPWRIRGDDGFPEFAQNHAGYFNCRAPRLAQEALDALRARPEPAPAQRPALQPAVVQPVVIPAQPVQVPAQHVAREECAICFDDAQVGDMRQLVCGHRFCVACLREQLDLAFRDRLEIDRHLHCPGQGCLHIINEVDIRAITRGRALIGQNEYIALYRAIRADNRRINEAEAFRARRPALAAPAQRPALQPAVQPVQVPAVVQPAQPAPAQRPAVQIPVQLPVAQPVPIAQRVWPAQNRGDYVRDDVTDEEIARLFAQPEQINYEQIRPNPHGPNDPNPNDPDDGPHGGGPHDPNPYRRPNRRWPQDPNPNQDNGPRFQEMPEPSNGPLIIGAGLVVAAIGATTYGCYKLYNYLTAAKPDAKKDLKTALAELDKEATKGEILATSDVYTKGAIKAFFQRQVKAGSFAALTHENMAMLTARVDALENACSNHGAIDEEYAAFMRCVSDLIATAPEVPVKATAKKVVAKRVVRAKRGTRNK